MPILPLSHFHPYFMPPIAIRFYFNAWIWAVAVTFWLYRVLSVFGVFVYRCTQCENVHFDNDREYNEPFQSKWSYCIKMSRNKASHCTFDTSNRTFQCVIQIREKSTHTDRERHTTIASRRLYGWTMQLTSENRNTKNNDIINGEMGFILNSDNTIAAIANETFYLTFVLLMFLALFYEISPFCWYHSN